MWFFKFYQLVVSVILLNSSHSIFRSKKIAKYNNSKLLSADSVSEGEYMRCKEPKIKFKGILKFIDVAKAFYSSNISENQVSLKCKHEFCIPEELKVL